MADSQKVADFDPDTPLTITLGQLTALMRTLVRDEISQYLNPRQEWITDEEATKILKRSHRTVINAIRSGKIKAEHVKPNPIGRGYLIHRRAFGGV